jgi:hypothetical protein
LPHPNPKQPQINSTRVGKALLSEETTAAAAAAATAAAVRAFTKKTAKKTHYNEYNSSKVL